VIYKTLAYRRQFPDLFAMGDYVPLESTGPLLSCIRRYNGNWALISVPLIRMGGAPPQPPRASQPRLHCTLPPDAPENWANAFTGDAVRIRDHVLEISDCFAKFPVVLLTARTTPGLPGR
jgi:maltooligosyltrehalose synthase